MRNHNDIAVGKNDAPKSISQEDSLDAMTPIAWFSTTVQECVNGDALELHLPLVINYEWEAIHRSSSNLWLLDDAPTHWAGH